MAGPPPLLLLSTWENKFFGWPGVPENAKIFLSITTCLLKWLFLAQSAKPLLSLFGHSLPKSAVTGKCNDPSHKSLMDREPSPKSELCYPSWNSHASSKPIFYPSGSPKGLICKLNPFEEKYQTETRQWRDSKAWHTPAIECLKAALKCHASLRLHM